MGMPLIEVASLKKEFQIQKRHPGLWGTVRDLLRPEYETKQAVDGVSFKIDKV